MRTALLLLTLPALAAAQDPDGWRYFVPAPGEAMEHPSPMALPLSPHRADDLTIGVETTGFARHGELRYGDADSRRVALLVDQRHLDDADLYLDLDRDRIVEEHERVPREGARWIATLPVETEAAEGGVVHLPRRMVFTLGKRGGIFAGGTMGYLEGQVTLAGKPVAARRVDGDANGFFTDPRDQLWLDLDGDGTFSALTELWLYAPLLELGGARYALRSDRAGADLALSLLEGSGHIDLDLGSVPGGAQSVRRLNVLLVGRDGSAVGVRALGAPIEVPIGEYRLGMVTLALVDPGGGAEWSFVFSDAGGSWERTWYPVAKDGTATVDPIGELQFQDGLTRGRDSVAPGDRLSGSPALLTEQSLLINVAYRGLDAPRWSFQGMTARVRLLSDTGAVLDEATSGFA